MVVDQELLSWGRRRSFFNLHTNPMEKKAAWSRQHKEKKGKKEKVKRKDPSR